MKIRLVLLAAFVALSACMSANAGAGAPGRGAAAIITQPELESMGTGDALSAVRRLRPGWLRTGPQQTLSDPLAPTEGLLVYMGALRLGAISSLSTLSINDIGRIEFLNAAQAQFRFGSGHMHGAIVVTPRAP